MLPALFMLIARRATRTNPAGSRSCPSTTSMQRFERVIAAGGTEAAAARDVSLGRVAAIQDAEGAVIGLARSGVGDPDDPDDRGRARQSRMD